MLGRGFQVARIGQVAVEIHPTWFIILGLLSWSLSDAVFPSMYEGWSTATYWVVGTIAGLLLLMTVLIHEGAHAVVAIRRGVPVPKITLFIFGGVSHLGRQPQSAGEEFSIAAAGPLTSFAVATVAAIVGFIAQGRQEQIEAIAWYLAVVNVALGVFNLLPGFPLDGGRVFRSIAWRKSGSFARATQIASGVGTMFGYGLILAGVIFLLNGYVLNGIWLAFIGWFLLGAARGEVESLKLESVLSKLHARDLMTEEFAVTTPGTSVQATIDSQMVGEGHRAVVVALADRVEGIVTITDVRKVPRTDWGDTPVARIMTHRADLTTVAADTPAAEVLSLVTSKSLNQVPVLDEGRMVGIITRRDILERVRIANELGAFTIDQAQPRR